MTAILEGVVLSRLYLSAFMFKIPKKSQYGLRVMAYLSSRYKKQGIFNIKEIAEHENIPFDYLEKIMERLREGKLLKSKKGMNGGYFLSKSPKEIKVKDIIDALEENLSLVTCLDKNTLCGNKSKCVARFVWQKLQNSLDNTLNSIKLTDIAK